MSAFDLLAEAKRRGIELRAEGERLRYEAPEGALTDDFRKALSDHREELLSLLRSKREGKLPLSFAQERLFFLRELAPESSFYNVPVRLRLRGPLEVAALEKSLDALVARHESLRTSFTAEGQAVAPPLNVALPIVDLESFRESEKLARRLSNQEASAPFDLEDPPLLRARLFRVAGDEHLLSLTLHHIVFDGWSLNVLLRDLAELYDAQVSGRAESLPALPIQYADFAIRQRELDLAPLVEFWKEKLLDLPPLSLPLDFPRPKCLSFRGRREWLSLPEELSHRIRALAAREGVSLATTLLAGFLVLLHRYTGEEEVFVGSPFAGRSRVEVENAIGFFVNSLVLRARVSGDPPFREFLARIADTVREAFDRSEAPFEKVVEALEPGRDLGRNPLFQIVFALQSAPPTEKPMGGLEVELEWAETGATRFDLEAHVWDDGKGLRLAFVYSSDLFEPETIRRMERRYWRLLEEIADSPGRRISELRYFDDDERERLLVEWNRTASIYPREATVHELFSEQAGMRSEAPALLWDGGSLSYRELDERSNRIARFLRAKGVGPESRVGLSLGRSASAIEAILGILKAGGVYVPIDAALPRERREFLVEDTGASLVLASGDLADAARESGEPIESGVSASNLAYVMYTSGSTGRPKGVAIPHRGVVRLVKGSSFVAMSPGERFLSLAPLGFDASTFEIWGSLLNGASLFVYPDETPALEDLGRTLRERGITTLWLTGTLFHQMVDQEVDSLASVRQIVAGGEALSPAHVRRLLERLPEGARLVNGYGPTEGTTFTCCHPMSSASRIEGSVPIGRPIENTRVYILDRYGEPVPPGIPGELFLTGDGLARGYFGKPDLTAERFVPDGVSGESGRRLYRTGDLSRFLPDGALEFLGRTDHQVKVRGFRIELPEVERTLEGMKDVREAVVLAREDAGVKRLVAYVVPSAGVSGLDVSRQHVDDWTALFEDTYRRSSAPVESDFDPTGWNSSYTGEPLSTEEMTEWVESTVARVLAKAPSRVLEIGCGTGLLLYRIASRASRYVATDVSSEALRSIRKRVSSRPELSRVELLEREAVDFEGIERAGFDTVILNSVTQYFPSADYLFDVLARAVERVEPGGRIFIGDVRALHLLEAFHDSLRERGQVVDEEGELLLDPSFFRRLRGRIPRVSDVEVFVKRGRHQNELTRFRYDVFLHVERNEAPLEARAIDWDGLEKLRFELQSGAPLEVRGIPNGRLLDEGAVDPETLWSLAADTGLALELTYSGMGPFHLDALFRSNGARAVFWPSSPVSPFSKERIDAGAPESNHPLQARLARSLVPKLRKRAQEFLPEYMVPHAFVLLERMPLGPTGKVDRRALPDPSRVRAERVSDYQAPRSDIEKTLARIWAEVLGLDRVGARDNFFELGGDSILAIGIVARARKEGFSLAVRSLFEHQTLGELAAAMEAAPRTPRAVAAAAPGEVPLIPIQSWFFELELEERSHFNQALLLELRQPIEIPRLSTALRRVESQNDAFRLRFRSDGGTWRQELVAAEGCFPLEVVDIEDVSELADRATEIQGRLDITKGPLARAALFRIGTGEPDRLLLAAHHLIVDAVSFRILVSDLDRALTEPPQAPRSSFASWAREVRARAETHRGEIDHWLEQEAAASPAIVRNREGLADFESLDRVSVSIDADEAEEEPLLLALVEAFGTRKLRVAVEGHGREDVDAVGWFTAMYPRFVDLDRPSASGGKAPGGGTGYGLLRYVLGALPSTPRPEVSFTYLGRLDSMFKAGSAFRLAKESAGRAQAGRGTRPHLIDVTARIQNGRLEIHWYFSRSIHDRKTVEDLARKHVESVRRRLRFPEARLDREKLRELESRFGRDEIEDVYPLTPMQRGMLFESYYQPQAGVYVEQYGLELDDLDESSFLEAWRSVLERHPALRTSIVGASWDEPHQLVSKKAVLDVSHHDLRELSAEEREAWLEEHRRSDRARGFELDAPALMRLSLIRLDERRTECLWTFHHIVLDGWSVPLVLSEVFQIQRGLSLPPAVPFRRFVAWLFRQDLGKAETFWRKKLGGLEGPTPLPLQSRRAPKTRETEEYGEERVVFPRSITESVRSLARGSQVTVNTVVLGAWSLLLSRHGGEEEVVLGTTVSGRPPELEGVESTVGLFINTLPLRVRFSPEAIVESFLRELQTLQLECREHEYSPLWQVHQWSELPAGVPLFETFFVFENYPDDALRLEVTGRSKPSVERSGYPLALAASLREELALRLFYDRKRFEPSSVKTLLTHLERILTGMVANPAGLLSKLTLLSPAERRRVLEEWNDTPRPSSGKETVVDRFERAAAENPEALALASAEVELTYGELNRRANRFAHRLLEIGMGPETLAGVLLPRGAGLVLAKLSILKTGGAYLPLDPEHPRERLARVVEDARPRVILSDGRNRALVEDTGVEIVDLDAGGASSETNPRRRAFPDGIAYAIYTSGSTGSPKGVAVSHRSLSNLVDWHLRAYDVSSSDRASQIAAPGFDACAWEIWPHLAAGASVHVPDDETRAAPGRLWSFLAEKGITIAFLPTPLAEAALLEPLPRNLALRVLMTGGDRLRSGVTGTLPFAFVNHYGLTETAVVATAERIGEVSPPPIGRPIDGTRAYILDRFGDPVPPGVKGEIVIGGGGVARGYLRAPHLTAERFVPDPFSGAGARMYRTGDLGRHLDSGSIEFLGRNDGQIQVRGFRVEMAEIESALVKHPEVSDARVALREDELGRKRLVAYYAGRAPTSDLPAFLKDRLPAPMIPAAFVRLESLPLSANGKVDWKRLPDPGLAETRSRERVAPRSRTEAVLARIWSEVLRSDSPSVHDNFFALGGDSILCIQIVARAKAEGIELTAKDVFEHPTIAGLAEVRGARFPTLVEEVDGPVPLTPIQRWFFEEELEEPHHFNQAFFFRTARPLSRERLEQALAAVHSHHAAFRLRYLRTDSGWIQTLARGSANPGMSFFDLSGLATDAPEERVQAMTGAASEIQRTFSLESGPLFRAALFDLGREQRLFLAAHHLIVDFVSWRLLLEDLEKALDDLESEKTPRLPPKTTSFASWARKLPAYDARDDAEYWLSVASRGGASIPRDYPSGRNRVKSADTVTLWSSPEDASSLFQRVQQAYNTSAEETVLTALVDALSEWTGTRKIQLTLEGHGREELFDGVDLTRTVGWFTSLYPVVLDVEGVSGPGGALKAIKEQMRAIPARGIGYGLLRHLGSDETIRAALARCRPEVAFNYLGRFDSALPPKSRFALALEPPGLTRSPRGLRRHVLEVTVIAAEEKLRFDWTFSRALHRRETVVRLASATLSSLRSLIAHCLDPSAGGYTPSDFALAGLSQAQLDQILKQKSSGSG